MIKSHRLSKNKDKLIIELEIPLKASGTYTYDESETWTVPNVAVTIDEKYCEYALSRTIYLDYKDSLQIGGPEFFFDTEQEALAFANKYGLDIMYQ